ncbi:MAG TPA: DUF5522 domain-containing protein [Tepidisphaeraceae bacterium]|jgi:hypothetical protein
METNDRPLIEGEDYVVENGRWVFTAAFLLRRGYCCESGCRHCPYRGRKPDNAGPGDAMLGKASRD